MDTNQERSNYNTKQIKYVFLIQANASVKKENFLKLQKCRFLQKGINVLSICMRIS